MLKLFKNLKGLDWCLFVISIGLIIGQVYLELEIPEYMKEISGLLQFPNTEISEILKPGLTMLACAFGALAAAVAVAVIASKISSRFSAELRSRLFNKVQSFSMSEINKFSTSSLITRSTNDVTQVQMLIVMGMQVVVKAPITAIWVIAKISVKNWQWTFTTGMAVVLLLLVVGVCVLIALPKFKKIQSLTDDLNRVTRESLTGIKVVHAYNAESYQEQKFAEANENLTSTNLFAGRVMSAMMPSIMLIMNGLSLAVFWIGAYLVNGAEMPERVGLFTDTVTFMSYAMLVVMSFMMLVMIFILYPRASVAAKRINAVLETSETILDGKIVNGDESLKGEVEFKNVSFKYPDAEEYIIKDLSFTARRGETIAIIGATGSGKSTVINLLPRFYDVTDGEIIVDGINVKDYSQKALREKIGYVSQKAVLFSGSVRSNVAFGGGDDEDVVDAVYVAQANDFVEKLDGGYDGYVAQGGGNFSGGQKQRLSIARAIYKNPEIFIFDDSFSALDYRTDKKLRDALKRECKEATKFIVAQRIGTIRDADKIIVLEQGKAVGIGSHEKLMESCEVYRQIALSQLNKEELA